MDKQNSEIASRVHEDHQSIKQFMGRLKTTVMKEIEPEHFPDWRLDFIWQLREFRNCLLKHFDLEEEGGFMQEVLEAAPQSHVKINQLQDEHVQIILVLDDIVTELKSMYKKKTDGMESIRTNLNEMITALHEHEHEEHILMQRAFFRDYGAMD